MTDWLNLSIYHAYHLSSDPTRPTQLRPWVEEFGLAGYGFVLTRVASACAPPEIRGHRGFKGAGLFYWKMHPEASFVESIFGGEHPSMPGRLLGEALGYPGREVGVDACVCCAVVVGVMGRSSRADGDVI